MLIYNHFYQNIRGGAFFYNLPKVQSTRGTSLGKGNKFDFTKEAKNKAPNFYNSGSDFDLEHPHSPKYTFGIGRENIYRNKNNDNIPGPGDYTTTKPFGTEGIKFSIRQKNSLNQSKLKVPGPGEYPNTIQTNPSLKFSLSTIQSQGQIIFGSSTSKRFNYSCMFEC